MNEEPVSPVVPPKSTLRPTSNILQRNKIDPADEDDEIEIIDHRKSNKSATLSSKRLSLRLPNAFRTSNKDGDTVSSKKFGFTLGSNSRKQRKQLDLSLFETEQQMKAEEEQDRSTKNTAQVKTNAGLEPPPILCDGSTLSSSSSTCSSTHSSYYSPVVSSKGNIPPTFKTVMNKQSNQNVFASGTPRRLSQASFKSIDRRGSNISSSTLGQQQQNRPATPSLLSNSSTINSPINNSNGNIPSQPAKASWLNNLFFFKQPKVCSLVVYSTHTAGILRSLHRLTNTVSTILLFYF